MSEDAVRVDPAGQRSGTFGETRTGGGSPGGRGAASGGRGSGSGLPVTTELLVLAVTAIAVLIAAAVADNFEAGAAWTLVTVLAVGYMLSRGFAKHEHRGDHHH